MTSTRVPTRVRLQVHENPINEECAKTRKCPKPDPTRIFGFLLGMARETWKFFYWNLTRPRPENSGLGFFSGFSGFLDTQVCKTLSVKIIVIVHLDELDKTCTQLTCYNSVYLHWTFAFFPKKHLFYPLLGPLLDSLLDPLLDPFLLKHWFAKALVC